MIDRILKSWKTTAIGVLIIAMAGGAVYFDKATLTEAGAFMVLGMGMFFAKDRKIEKK